MNVLLLQCHLAHQTVLPISRAVTHNLFSECTINKISALVWWWRWWLLYILLLFFYFKNLLPGPLGDHYYLGMFRTSLHEIFTIGRHMGADDGSSLRFPSDQVTLKWQTISGPNRRNCPTPPSVIALAFHHIIVVIITQLCTACVRVFNRTNNDITGVLQ